MPEAEINDGLVECPTCGYRQEANLGTIKCENCCRDFKATCRLKIMTEK